MMKLKSKSGSTLTFTIVILTVLTILALTVAMVVGLSSKMQINKYQNLNSEIILENKLFEVVSEVQKGTSLADGESVDGEFTILKSSESNNTVITITYTVNTKVAYKATLDIANDIISWGKTSWN